MKLSLLFPPFPLFWGVFQDLQRVGPSIHVYHVNHVGLYTTYRPPKPLQ